MSYREIFSSGEGASGERSGGPDRLAAACVAGRNIHVFSGSVRIDIADAVLERRFAELASVVAEASLALFQEDVPHAADSIAGGALWQREMARGLAPSIRNAVRIVRLRFDDEVSRFVMTADRGIANKAMLLQMLKHLLTGAGVDAHTPVDAEASAGASTDWAPVAAYPPVERWSAPGEGTGYAATQAVTTRGTANDVRIAVARVLHAFCRGHEGSMPVLTETEEGVAEWTLHALAVDPSDTVAGMRAGIWPGTRLGAGGLTSGHRAELEDLWGSPADFMVGMIVVDAWPIRVQGIVDERYIPFIQPCFPITLMVETAGEDRVSLSVRYERGAIRQDDVGTLLASLVHVLEGMHESRAARVLGLPLLAEAAQRDVLALGAGRGPGRLLSEERLEHRVAAIAQASPQAFAVSDDTRTMTYRQLDEDATRMAACLASRGIGRGDRVGLCLPRSANMLVAALAILKSGAAYVPVDPDSPADRIAYICEDARVALLVFDNDERPAMPEIAALAMTEWTDLASAESLDWTPGVKGDLDDPAYMIYTSGSTGRPKGVLVAHRNVQALLGAVRDEFRLRPDDVWSLFHSFAFDFSVWEAWGALLTGARVHVFSYDVTRDTDSFIDELNRREITVLSQTPSAFGALVAAERLRSVGSSLRLVVFGGEPLDARALLPWFDRHPERACRLVNMFGITETTVHVTAKDVRRQDAIAASRSVGRPIDGWQVSVRATDGTLLPCGVDGEIHVAGAGVAIGYHERPELNERRFVPDPAGTGRMYRSGDRGRMLPDGELLHLGRLDNQVKLRGFRIELDEIRNVLLRCHGVEAAAVTFDQRDPSDPATARIDAYVVLDGVGLRDVWTRATQALPAYMLPSSIARVAAMPLTGNGKLHTARLEGSVLERAGAMGKVADTAPVPAAGAGAEGTGGFESQLAAIWSEIFARDIVGDDNFFDLGGNSLIAIRISARLRERGLPGLSLRDLYVHQTVAGVARALEGRAN